MNDDLLTRDRIEKTLIYYRDLEQQVKDRLDQLAVKMGIDPDTDLVFVPEGWILGFKRYPEWIAPSKDKHIYVKTLCRKTPAEQKKKEK